MYCKTHVGGEKNGDTLPAKIKGCYLMSFENLQPADSAVRRSQAAVQRSGITHAWSVLTVTERRWGRRV